MLLEKEIIESEKAQLQELVSEFKSTNQCAFKLLHLLKNDIRKMIQDDKKVKQQLSLINTSLKIKISYETYRNFYYTHVKKKEKPIKQIDSNKLEEHENQIKSPINGIFDNLK